MGEISRFTSQNTGVAGVSLPQSVTVFMLLCDLYWFEILVRNHQSRTMTQRDEQIEAVVDLQLEIKAPISQVDFGWFRENKICLIKQKFPVTKGCLVAKLSGENIALYHILKLILFCFVIF